MKKAINLAFATNSYKELIGICHDFLTKKQEALNDQNQVKESNDNEELDLTNPIVTARKGRPAGRAKSIIEVQDKENKRNCVKSVDLNIQKSREIELDKSNRKKCRNCGQKGHNRATCKFTV